MDRRVERVTWEQVEVILRRVEETLGVEAANLLRAVIGRRERENGEVEKRRDEEARGDG